MGYARVHVSSDAQALDRILDEVTDPSFTGASLQLRRQDVESDGKDPIDQ
jgi:hypothetical protein